MDLLLISEKNLIDFYFETYEYKNPENFISYLNNIITRVNNKELDYDILPTNHSIISFSEEIDLNHFDERYIKSLNNKNKYYIEFDIKLTLNEIVIVANIEDENSKLICQRFYDKLSFIDYCNKNLNKEMYISKDLYELNSISWE